MSEIAEIVRKKYSDYDVELQFGGQPVYHYILGVE